MHAGSQFSSKTVAKAAARGRHSAAEDVETLILTNEGNSNEVELPALHPVVNAFFSLPRSNAAAGPLIADRAAATLGGWWEFCASKDAEQQRRQHLELS